MTALSFEPYFQGLREGRLRAQRCTRCSAFQLYPRTVCSHCWSEKLEWLELSGRGTVYSFTIVHRAIEETWAKRTPYVIALIDVDQGLRLLGNVDGPPENVNVGRGVELIPAADNSTPGPLFQLLD